MESSSATEERSRMGSSMDRELRDHREQRRLVRTDRVLWAAFAAGLGWTVLFTLFVWLGHSRPRLEEFVGNVLYAAPDAGAAVLALFAVRASQGRARRMWALLAIANVSRLTGDAIWAGYAYLATEVPYPSVASIAYLAQYLLVVPVLLIGFRGTSRVRLTRGLLDTALVVLGVGAVGCQLLLAPQLHGPLTLAAGVDASYLLGDLAVLGCLLGVGLSGHRMVPYAVLVVGAAFGVNALTDVSYAYFSLFTSYTDDTWLNVGWEWAAVLQCLAAVVAIRHREGEARTVQLDRDLTFLPVLVAVVATCAMIAMDELNDGRVGRGALIVVGIMLTGLLVRQWMTTSDRTRLAVRLQAALQEQERLAVTDGLTGLYNRRFFQEALRLEAERANRDHTGLALIVLDLDHFKRVNDTYGHPVGDVVLAQAADRIRHASRSSDVVARYGGEEFVCVLPGAEAASAVQAAERLRRVLRQNPVPAGDGNHVQVTVSAGVATAGHDGWPIDVERLINAADAALYQAKAAGRDRVVLADEVPVAVAVDRPAGAAPTSRAVQAPAAVPG